VIVCFKTDHLRAAAHDGNFGRNFFNPR